jgi:hypothetical protein
MQRLDLLAEGAGLMSDRSAEGLERAWIQAFGSRENTSTWELGGR